MMAIHIPPDMIPRMDWNAEDKQAAWAFYRERLEQYFMIAGTPREAKVTHGYSLLWCQGGIRVMDSLEGPGGREQR